MAEIKKSFLPPYKSPISDGTGKLSTYWEYFFRSVFERLYPLGTERSFVLANNQSSAANITGARLSPRGVTCAFFEYLVQRITSSVELTEVGLLIFVYNPTSETWSKVTVSEHNPDNAGVVFSITADGQIQYTTDNQSGDITLSSVFYRMRTLAGKSGIYSSIGAV